MKYYNVLDAIKSLCVQTPNAGDVFDGDIYNNLNNNESVKYTAFNILLQEVHENREEDYKTFHFFIFYVDRLLTDSSNLTEVQSHGMEVLGTIVNSLEDAGTIINEVVYYPFQERFNDVCGGCYADLVIRIDTNDCGDYELTI